MVSRPVVGVTGPARGGTFPWVMTWLALWRAGARAVRITPATSVDRATLKGLVIGGGSDVAPDKYDEELKDIPRKARQYPLRDIIWSVPQLLLRLLFSRKKKGDFGLDPERDELEMDLCRFALDRNLPVLGICRGAQLLNVVLGGSLHQDTRMFYEETPNMRTVLPRKTILLTTGSRLHRILRADFCLVNSLHNQAINQLGEGLVVTAREPNSVVQGIEHTERPFTIGVQWHPEYLPQVRRQQRLFRELATVAGRQ